MTAIEAEPSKAQQSRMSVDEFNGIIREHLPLAEMFSIRAERIDYGSATLRLPTTTEYLRPGGTISGPTMMALADVVMYAIVLGMIGRVELAVTSNLNMNFLRKPKPGDLIGEGRIIKLGRRLAIGDVMVHSAAEPEKPVAQSTVTYAIP